MRILATTQGTALQLMLKLSEAIREKLPHELSLIVSDSSQYLDALKDEEISGTLEQASVLKEWDLFRESKQHDHSPKETSYWEDLTGEPLIWTTLADRRLMFGKYCKRIQDYRPCLSDDRMLQIVSYGYKAIDQFFYKEMPDVVLAFGMATYCDYITAKIAEKHEIPFYILKSAKMGNCVSLNNHPFEWSSSIWERFNKTSNLLSSNNITLESIDRAQKHVQEILNSGIRYEGTLDLSGSFRRFSLVRAVKSIGKGAALALTKGRDPVIRGDHHLDGYFIPALYEEIVQPWRAWKLSEFLKDRYVDPDRLQGGKRRIFFPLHFEPEVSLQVYGRPYQNQIEVIRQLALASPADCEIMVKEHPRSIGFRPLSYYRKLLQIPKVRLFPPLLPSNRAIGLCHAVAVISGTIGLEAAIQGKPVLVLGKPPYRHVGKPHFHFSRNPWKLQKTVNDILDPATSDAIRRAGEEVFIRLLSIVFEESCLVDLYTIFLRKSGRQKADIFGEQMSRRHQLKGLVEYLTSRLSVIKEKSLENKVA